GDAVARIGVLLPASQVVVRLFDDSAGAAQLLIGRLIALIRLTQPTRADRGIVCSEYTLSAGKFQVICLAAWPRALTALYFFYALFHRYPVAAQRGAPAHQKTCR